MTGPEPATPPAGETVPHRRRKRYAGKNPRRFGEKYKELNPERYAADVAKVLAAGKTPAGSHRPIMVAEILGVLALMPGECAVDCTLGFGGHTREMLARVAPGGRLVGLDVDPIELPKTTARLRAAGWGEDVFTAVRSNFAALPKVLAELGLDGVDAGEERLPRRSARGNILRNQREGRARRARGAAGQPSQHLGQTPLGHSGRRQTRLNEPARLGST
jgi:hypothetical protein